MRNEFAKVSDPNSFISASGDLYHTIYDPYVNPDGTVSLVESGKVDINEQINSYKEQCDMSFVLSRLMIGDTSVLTDKEPMYGDFTAFPKTYAEVLQLTINAEKDFYKLPPDVRNKFDNDWQQWFAQVGNDDWFTKMDSIIVKDDVVEEEVKENE